MIGIIDYGMGNLFSVSKALERLNVPYTFIERPEQMADVAGFILPGVGSFRDAMSELEQRGFVAALRANDKPLLGICLGMQLLFQSSEENGVTEGLGLLPGRVVKFRGGDYKVPHMGWNELMYEQETPLGQPNGHVYFVHSYYVETDERDILIATAQYDIAVPALVGRGRLFGAQFHPEKSGEVGMKLLQNFSEYVEVKQR